jgi:hypothetical protein
VQDVRYFFNLGLIPTGSGTKIVCKAQTVCLAKSIHSLVKLYIVLYRKENGCGKKISLFIMMRKLLGLNMCFFSCQ